MFQFKQFLSEYDALQNEVARLINEESDTIAWDPKVGAEFAGVKGVTSDTGAGKQERPQPQQGRPKVGDIVFIQDPNGQYTPGLIAKFEQNNAVIVNRKKNVNALRPVTSFRPAPPTMMKQFPNRSGWVYVYNPLDV